MNITIAIVILVIVFVAILTLLIIVGIKFFKSNTDTNSDQIDWSEYRKGYMSYKGFPPCFFDEPYAKNIYNVISSNNLLSKYHNLLDYISILLCLFKRCTPQDIKDRLKWVINFGANTSNKDSIDSVKDYLNKTNDEIYINDQDLKNYLIGTVYIINQELNKLKSDSNLSQEDKDAIIGYMYNIYRNYYPDIVNKCPI